MPKPDSTSDEKYALRSVGRALDVLQALGRGSTNGMTVAEVAEAVGVSKSTAFALLQALIGRGFVSDSRVGGSRLYRLGMALIHLGDRAVQEIGISQVATPILNQLAEATGMTARLAILDEGYAVAIARVDAPGIFRLASSLGRRELPHCSAVGKALLARLPQDKLMPLLQAIGLPRRTERTLVEPARLIEDLALTSWRGYAVDDEEDNLGVLCVGAAVYDRNEEAVAAVSVTTIKLDRGDIEVAKLGATVRAHADRISQLIGGPAHAALKPLPR
ncbi:IclR family transcriptional regulator [Labrys wisconsinensis]|uniref:IclR family acetate operon transcriptional repressor n=1 Tax=Labrys wisconsinensis TaxID=425677 RepID=A0ABU0JBK5_9HYPH|nr:IclR family transcriptional regulator [Labrys wisconsinensis]MDQ0470654.1 IclR family acetate operon transcriptional repressor [Labrys wisconsinensis]